MAFSIITGASKGIGKAIAYQLAAKKRDLILISLPGEDLETISEKISQKWDILVETYETDLTKECSVQNLFQWIRENEFEIDILINNAGIGSQESFMNSSREQIERIMALNMDATVSMTWYCIPYLKKHQQSYLMNVGSAIAYAPIPYKAVYAATKNFILSFSNALHQELRNTGISVSCLCPGPTLTNRIHEKKVQQQGVLAKWVALKAESVAEAAVRGMFKNKRVIIPGFGNKIITRMGKHLTIKRSLKIAGNIFQPSPLKISG